MPNLAFRSRPLLLITVPVGALVLAGIPALSARAAAPTTEAPVCRDAVVVHKAGQVPVPGADGGQICVGTTGHYATEQTLAVDDDGTVVLGVTADRDPGVITSKDGGRSWTKRVPRVNGGSILDPAMGWVERDKQTNRIFASSALDETCAIPIMGDVHAYSDDEGATWTTVTGQMCDGGDWGKTFIGRPTQASSVAALAAAGYPNVVYHCSGGTFQNERHCWKSLDGGKSFRRTGSTAFTMLPDPNDPKKRAPAPARTGPTSTSSPGRRRRHRTARSTSSSTPAAGCRSR